ncbi:MAG TPA: hypothetical protein VKK31_14090 [Thermoanaerobaculia bacterium]|nr:hypothetical protein [Thermoanaerobaculia bacterium]
MDYGLLGFAAILSIPIFYVIHVIFHLLNKQWREVRAKEQFLEQTRLEQKVEWLTNRAEAQEKTLEDSRRNLAPAAEDLDRASEEYGRRLENLEAVVVGQVGKAVDPPGLGEEGGSSLPTRPHEVTETSTKSSKPKGSTKNLNRRRTAKLAHRFDK